MLKNTSFSPFTQRCSCHVYSKIKHDLSKKILLMKVIQSYEKSKKGPCPRVHTIEFNVILVIIINLVSFICTKICEKSNYLHHCSIRNDSFKLYTGHSKHQRSNLWPSNFHRTNRKDQRSDICHGLFSLEFQRPSRRRKKSPGPVTPHGCVWSSRGVSHSFLGGPKEEKISEGKTEGTLKPWTVLYNIMSCVCRTPLLSLSLESRGATLKSQLFSLSSAPNPNFFASFFYFFFFGLRANMIEGKMYLEDNRISGGWSIRSGWCGIYLPVVFFCTTRSCYGGHCRMPAFRSATVFWI